MHSKFSPLTGFVCVCACMTEEDRYKEKACERVIHSFLNLLKNVTSSRLHVKTKTSFGSRISKVRVSVMVVC